MELKASWDLETCARVVWESIQRKLSKGLLVLSVRAIQVFCKSELFLSKCLKYEGSQIAVLSNTPVPPSSYSLLLDSPLIPNFAFQSP